ncbi:uncharacterized protein LOC120149166, partial [Hibiscus syriacus]|uniref:uncharacterized protein LOC120149166 n=1 Tax=Hibiscus syriacus TaxID=106335 RepID=UPI0019220AA9
FAFLYFFGFILKKKLGGNVGLKAEEESGPKGYRLLVSITVLGSSGPIQFTVNEEELVECVIDTVLKAYAREGRLPVLGFDMKYFFLYCPSDRSDALSSWETIG